MPEAVRDAAGWVAERGPVNGLWRGLPVLFKQHTLQHAL